MVGGEDREKSIHCAGSSFCKQHVPRELEKLKEGCQAQARGGETHRGVEQPTLYT